jgi:DNA-binding MarR family transcriptional regulator
MATRKAETAERLTKSDYERLATFRYILRRFLTFSAEAAEQAGLPAQQHQALLAIKGFAGADQITTGNLAARLDIRHHSAVGLVDRLVRNGLVKRRTSTVDRREVLIALTTKGEKVLAELSLSHREELQRIGPLLQELLAAIQLPGDDA